MTIGEITRQGLHYAWTCKSLWLFGFFVGLASGGSGGGGRGDGAASIGFLGLSVRTTVAIAVAAVLLAIAAFVMRFISEGALIEGIARIRRGGTMTTREGFRAGWAHWGVLLRIFLLYITATIVTMAIFVVPCALAFRAFGVLGGIAFVIPALVMLIPVLVTLYLLQAFASQIAVFENRYAIDAIRKARLFLHGRLMHGLKLIVATFAGTIVLFVIGLLIAAPVVLMMVASIRVTGAWPAIVMASLVLLPAFVVLTAMVGTMKSSIWTIGYLTQVEA